MEAVNVTDEPGVQIEIGARNQDCGAGDVQLVKSEFREFVQLQQYQIDHIAKDVSGGVGNIEEIYPLTPAQEGFLFHHLLNERADSYVLSQLFWLASRDRVDSLVRGMQRVVERHSILRTAIAWEQLPRPVQVVYRQAVLPVEELTLSADRNVEAQLEDLIKSHGWKIDLGRAPLMRLCVAADPYSANWYAILRYHHIILDYESLKTVISETLNYSVDPAEKLDTSIPYRVHVMHALAAARMTDSERFFRGKLGEISEPTTPFGLLDVHGYGVGIRSTGELIDSALAQRIRIQSRRLGVSVSRIFHAAWGLVVAHTSGQADVVYGTVLLASWQRAAGTQRMPGMSINTLPICLRLGGISAQELVEHTQRELADLLAYEQASLMEVQRCSDVPKSMPLFSSLLNYRHNEARDTPEWGGVNGIRVLTFGDALTNYPITLKVDDDGKGFFLTAETDARVDSRRMVGYAQIALQSLTEALESAPETPALALSILPLHERRQILESFNNTCVQYPHKKLIHELFEDQVLSTPHAIAVVFDNQRLTYAELNGRADRIARELQMHGVVPDSLVAAYVERSIELVVALLGVLKAGGAYMPLDLEYPAERLRYMIEDAKPLIILTQERLAAALPQTTAAVLMLDHCLDQLGDAFPDLNGGNRVGAQNLAYVIYTSGTTGFPKGVMNEHGGVVNRLLWMQEQYQLTPQDRVLQKTPITFDVSVWEFFWPLLNGATLVLARPGGHRDPCYLMELIAQKEITIVHFVPSMLNAFLAQGPERYCRSLRRVVCSGEELSVSLQNRCLKQLPWARLCNLYGPTEAAVDVTFWECQSDDRGERVPIGRPISNIQMYVLDAYREPVPLGVTGEIYIGGVGVARGYLNRAELTAERFMRDPFNAAPHGRMYKTGDLGRWREDGTIEYLGRRDQQIKLRGLRIELGEIEAQLLKHHQVKEAAVMVREDAPGEKRLVAYITMADSMARTDTEELLAQLKTSLPEYMVPSALVVLQAMPLTRNGKLDRGALPAPEMGSHLSEGEQPQGETEEALAEIWRKILRLEDIGRHDNFIAIGGDSLLGMDVLQNVQRHFMVRLPLVSVIQYPTIYKMAELVEMKMTEKRVAATQEKLGESS